MLRRIVARQVRASDPLIDDACQSAWGALVHHRGRVRREKALGWLATTAVREALKLIRQQRRELSLDALVARGDEPTPAAGRPSSLEEVIELRSRLTAIRDLPERQQRLVLLQGLGLTYTEMAGYTGATPRTVERQLLRAKRALRAAA